jgi:hypothetical protein
VPTVARPPRHSFLMLYLPAAMLLLAPALVLAASGRTLAPEVSVRLALVTALPLVTPALLRTAARAWDPFLLAPAWMLCALGLAVIARVQPGLLGAQLLWISAGWAAFIALARFGPLLPGLERFRHWLFAGGIALVAATFVFGDDVTGEGARLWLNIGPITMQPTELLRLLLIVFTAGQIARRAPLQDDASQSAVEGRDGSGRAPAGRESSVVPAGPRGTGFRCSAQSPSRWPSCWRNAILDPC